MFCERTSRWILKHSHNFEMQIFSILIKAGGSHWLSCVDSSKRCPLTLGGIWRKNLQTRRLPQGCDLLEMQLWMHQNLFIHPPRGPHADLFDPSIASVYPSANFTALLPPVVSRCQPLLGSYNHLNHKSWELGGGVVFISPSDGP